MRQSKRNQILLTGGVLAALVGLLTVNAGAMHIAEGYLPVNWCLLWGAVCVPFVVAGFFSIKRRIDQAPRAKILLAMCGALHSCSPPSSSPPSTAPVPTPPAWAWVLSCLGP